MKYLLLLILTFSLVFESLASGGCTGPVIPCSDASPFCTTNTYNFPNETSTCTPSGPNYGCLSSTPNPVWYYMEVDVSGTFQINLSQTTGTNGTGSGLDVDFGYDVGLFGKVRLYRLVQWTHRIFCCGLALGNCFFSTRSCLFL